MAQKPGSRLRGILYSALLNPIFTRVLDRLSPADSLGGRGERTAKRYLLKHGFVIIHQGYRDSIGEIDLIAVQDETIVFVEVKTRISDFAGDPLEAVDYQKQQKITRTALSFLQKHDLLECRVRFDVISVLWPDTTQPAQIAHIENAFEALT